MGTCKTCKHWKPTHEGDGCNWGYCDQIIAARVLHLEMVGFATDDECRQQGHKRPMTSFEFGCVKYDPTQTWFIASGQTPRHIAVELDIDYQALDEERADG